MVTAVVLIKAETDKVPELAQTMAELEGVSEVFSVAGGYVARYFIGLTEGWFSPGHTSEDVRDNFDAIRDASNYDIFTDPSGEVGTFHAHKRFWERLPRFEVDRLAGNRDGLGGAPVAVDPHEEPHP